MEFNKIIQFEVKDIVSLRIYASRKELIILPLLFSISAYFIPSDKAPQSNWLFIIASFVCTSIALFFIMYGLMVYQAKKAYNTTKPLQIPHKILLDEFGIHRSSEYGNSDYKWEYIFKAIKTKKAIYIYFFKKQIVVIIPKRLISVEEEINLISLLIKNLPNNKVKL